MSTGLNDSFEFLAKTENEASVDVLVSALECQHSAIQDRVLRALLARRNPKGHEEVFRRLPKLDQRCRSIIAERPERLVRAATGALKGLDERSLAAAFDAIISFRLYDTMPALVRVLIDNAVKNVGLVGKTILRLTELFYRELSEPGKRIKRGELDNLRRRVTAALEESINKFTRHESKEAVEAFLLVAKRQNVTLRRILQQPRERSRFAIVEVLSESTSGGVIRLLLGFLEDSQMPQVIRGILASRTDEKFVANLLEKVGSRPSRSVAASLKRFDTFAWALPNHEVFEKLDGDVQGYAVETLAASSMDRTKVLDLLGFLLLDGKPKGRQAAARRLAEFEGPEANTLVIKAINDDDPAVRAHLAGQLRSRRIPGAMSLLIRMVGSRDESLQRALREALPEFTYAQFIRNFDSLPEGLLPTSGHLVRQIDEDARPTIIAEMTGQSPVRRRRAVLAANSMGLVRDLEQYIIKLLSDDDHMVRIAAAKALAECDTMPSWDALREALLDRSVIVKEAAEQSLVRISESLLKQTAEEDKEEGNESQSESEEVVL